MCTKRRNSTELKRRFRCVARTANSERTGGIQLLSFRVISRTEFSSVEFISVALYTRLGWRRSATADRTNTVGFIGDTELLQLQATAESDGTQHSIHRAEVRPAPDAEHSGQTRLPEPTIVDCIRADLAPCKVRQDHKTSALLASIQKWALKVG